MKRLKYIYGNTAYSIGLFKKNKFECQSHGSHSSFQVNFSYRYNLIFCQTRNIAFQQILNKIHGSSLSYEPHSHADCCLYRENSRRPRHTRASEKDILFDTPTGMPVYLCTMTYIRSHITHSARRIQCYSHESSVRWH